MVAPWMQTGSSMTSTPYSHGPKGQYVNDGDLQSFEPSERATVTVYNSMVARHMGFVFASAWVPIPGASGMVQANAEKQISQEGFDHFIPGLAPDIRHEIIRYFTRRRFALKTLGVIPYAGAVGSILHIYGLSRFVLALGDASMNSPEFFEEDMDAHLTELWADFEPNLWDGSSILKFYQETTGSPVSPQIRTQFTSTVETLEQKYIAAQDRIPGFEAFQEKGEEIDSYY